MRRLCWIVAAGVMIGAGCGAMAAGVGGKPFEVSRSVTEYCALRPPALMCTVFKPQLAEFLAETRDAKWAAPIEALIEKSMLEKGKSWMEIRALECRRTLCALEYAVNANDTAHDVDGSPELDRLMEPIGGVVAPEVSLASGGRIVSVLIWRKRS